FRPAKSAAAAAATAEAKVAKSGICILSASSAVRFGVVMHLCRFSCTRNIGATGVRPLWSTAARRSRLGEVHGVGGRAALQWIVEAHYGGPGGGERPGQGSQVGLVRRVVGPEGEHATGE